MFIIFIIPLLWVSPSVTLRRHIKRFNVSGRNYGYNYPRRSSNRRERAAAAEKNKKLKLRNIVVGALTGAFILVIAIFSIVRWAVSTDEEALYVPDEAPVASAPAVVTPPPSDAPEDPVSSEEPVYEEYLTEDSYQTANVTLTVERVSTEIETGKLTYYVADIVFRDMSSFGSAFSVSQDKISNTYINPLEIAAEQGAILAINCDNAGYNKDGIIVRNGTLYRFSPSDREIMMIFADGTMDVVKEKSFSAKEDIIDLITNKGLLHTFSFGPGLVYDGERRGDYSDCLVKPKNPRTAVGMVEPGHFKFVVVDGRCAASDGLTIFELEDLMIELGCKEAYNLDGGKSSIMIFDGSRLNDICDEPDERPVTDIIFVK